MQGQLAEGESVPNDAQQRIVNRYVPHLQKLGRGDARAFDCSSDLDEADCFSFQRKKAVLRNWLEFEESEQYVSVLVFESDIVLQGQSYEEQDKV